MSAQNMPGPSEALADLFREALAFGLVYGPEIPPHQWDELRDEKARQLAERAAAIAKAAKEDGRVSPAPAGTKEGGTSD